MRRKDDLGFDRGSGLGWINVGKLAPDHHRDEFAVIEFGDRTGERWFTVGVSPNIIDASFQALTDSITYKLMRAGAKA